MYFELIFIFIFIVAKTYLDKEIIISNSEEQLQSVDHQNIISTNGSNGNNSSKCILSRKMFCYI